MQTLIILGIPFLGTVLGAAMVFLLKDRIPPRLEKTLLGFAAGVMIAASVWSLLIPSIDMAKEIKVVEWLPAVVGFLLGMGFLLLLDTVTPHLHLEAESPEGPKSKTEKLKKTTMLLFAVTLHNIPEGMAVGVAYAGAMMGSGITQTAALALAIGIAIQNFPEGAIISMPLFGEGMSKPKSFLSGVMSGIVEPVAGAVTILMASMIKGILPYFLSFAAGAMIYVVVEELIPESQSGKHTNMATIGVAFGFALMMVLDVALG